MADDQDCSNRTRVSRLACRTPTLNAAPPSASCKSSKVSRLASQNISADSIELLNARRVNNCGVALRFFASGVPTPPRHRSVLHFRSMSSNHRSSISRVFANSSKLRHPLSRAICSNLACKSGERCTSMARCYHSSREHAQVMPAES